MRTLLIMLSFVMLLSGMAFARGEYAPERVRRGGAYADPQYRSMPNVPRNNNAPARGAPQTERRAKKNPDPYDPKYNQNYRPRF